MTNVLIWKENSETKNQPYEDRDREWNDASNSQGTLSCWQPAKSKWRTSDWIYLRTSKKRANTAHPYDFIFDI